MCADREGWIPTFLAECSDWTGRVLGLISADLSNPVSPSLLFKGLSIGTKSAANKLSQICDRSVVEASDIGRHGECRGR